MNGDREKSILGDTSVWAPILSGQFQNITGFNTEHENTCPFPSHIASSIPTLRGMYSHLTVCKRKKFCIKLAIYVYIKYIKNFRFQFFAISLTAKLDENVLAKKKIFFQNYKFFIDKATFNFYSFNKINDFVTTQHATAISFPFYLIP